MKPNWRMPTGVFIILGLILVLAILIAALSPWIGRLPVWGQMLVYAGAGIVWIAPLKPLLRWMETGAWR